MKIIIVENDKIWIKRTIKLVDFDISMTKTIKLAIEILTKNNLIEIKEKREKNKVAIDKIIYIKKEKSGKYCKIKTTDDNYRVRETIKNLKEKTSLPQIERDLLINKKYINNITEYEKILNNND